MRVWVYKTLQLSELWTPAKGGVHQTSALIKVPDEKPYAYYRMGISRGPVHSDGQARVTPFQVIVHDVPGDYMLIDELLGYAKDALTAMPPLVPEPRLIQCDWLENSEDIPQDPTTGTIAKIARFNLVHTERTP